MVLNVLFWTKQCYFCSFTCLFAKICENLLTKFYFLPSVLHSGQTSYLCLLPELLTLTENKAFEDLITSTGAKKEEIRDVYFLFCSAAMCVFHLLVPLTPCPGKTPPLTVCETSFLPEKTEPTSPRHRQLVTRRSDLHERASVFSQSLKCTRANGQNVHHEINSSILIST